MTARPAADVSGAVQSASGTGIITVGSWSVRAGQQIGGWVTIEGASSRARFGAGDSVWGEVASGGGDVTLAVPSFPASLGGEVVVWAGSVDVESVSVTVALFAW